MDKEQPLESAASNDYDFQKVSRRAPLQIDEDEAIKKVVHRHPFGLFLIFLGTFITLASIMIIIYIVPPGALTSAPQNTNVVLASGMGLAVITTLLVMLVATYVYRESRLIVTNKHVIQLLQSGLFSRKISRLSMANVEDVTAEQKGIFATIFNYGTIYVETAGEQKNFQFYNCPKPNQFAEEILEAREAFINDLNSATIGHRRLDQQMPIR